MNDKNKLDFKVGQELPIYKVLVSYKNYRKYNRLIKEINPLHFNKNYAQKLGYETIVVAGNFLFTYVPKWIIDWVGDAAVIKNITVKFENPVYIDEEIIHKGEITSITDTDDKKIVKCKYTVSKTTGEKTSQGTVLLNFNLQGQFLNST